MSDEKIKPCPIVDSLKGYPVSAGVSVKFVCGHCSECPNRRPPEGVDGVVVHCGDSPYMAAIAPTYITTVDHVALFPKEWIGKRVVVQLAEGQ